MYKVHVVPGWAEGNWHFKQFVRGSKEFVLEREAVEADIIVAHSSGVYSLPHLAPEQTVILIDPPYWPGRSIGSRVIQHLFIDIPRQRRNYGFLFWVRLRFWNLVYLSFEPWRHVKLWRSLRKTFELSLDAHKSALIWDNRDAYCGRQIKELVKKFPDMKLIEVGGLHESCWAHPEEYLKAIVQL